MFYYAGLNYGVHPYLDGLSMMTNWNFNFNVYFHKIKFKNYWMYASMCIFVKNQKCGSVYRILMKKNLASIFVNVFFNSFYRTFSLFSVSFRGHKKVRRIRGIRFNHGYLNLKKNSTNSTTSLVFSRSSMSISHLWKDDQVEKHFRSSWNGKITWTLEVLQYLHSWWAFLT